jgi:outer membrane protein assembly factor BamB
MPEAELRPAAGKPAPPKSRPSEPVPSKSRPSEPAPADADEPAEHAAPAKSLETPETPGTAETPEPDRTTATVVLMRARAAKASAVSTPSLSRPTRRHILLSVAGVTAAAGVSTAIAAVAERYDKDGGPSSGSGSKAASEWTVAFPGTISEPPIVTGGLVYALTANGHARALDAATGEERWSADIGSVGLDTPGIAVTAGTAYLVGSSSVQALDAVTGDRKWTFSADSPLKGRLQVAGDTLCTGGELAAYAIDATSGKQRWKVRRRDFLAWEPAVGDGKTYLASDNTVTAVDASTGTRSWTFGVDDGRSSTPWLVAGMVLVAGARWDNENRTQRATLHAVDTATGKERWKVPTPYVVDTLGAAGDLIYAEMVQMAVCALDAGTGKQRWSFRTGSSGSVRPVVSGDTLLVGGRGNRLTALNAATGVERWSFSAADALWADPAVAGGVVYIADRSGTLSALDAATGERRWAMDTQGAVKERPVVAHDVIYVPAGSKLHALPLKGRGVTRG